jgi:hypothetical protein
MRRAVAVAAVALAALSIVAVAHAKPSKHRLAVMAVKEAVEDRFPQFSKAFSGKIPVSCKRLSRQKFKCQWRARNSVKERARGNARVTVYSRGGDARLYNVRCEAQFGGCLKV